MASESEYQFVSSPARALLSSEILRIGSALLPNTNGSADTDLWIAMETAVPHNIIGIATTPAAANELITYRVAGSPPADVYGPYRPSVAAIAAMDESDPSDHNNCSSTRSAASSASGSINADIRTYHRKQSDVVSMKLTVTWTHTEGKPDSADFAISPRADAVFLTRSAREAFLYPRYLSVHGPEFLAAVRTGLGES